MVKKNKNAFIKYFFAVLIFILIGARDIVDLSIPNNLIVGVATVPLILLPYHHAISFLFFILPFTCGIPGYTVLLSYILIFVKAKQYNIWQFLPLLIIGGLEFIHISFSNVDVDLVTSISFLSFIALFFFLLFDPDESVDRKACIRMFIYGSIAVFLIVYVGILMNNSFEDLLYGTLRSAKGMGIEGADEEEIKGNLALNANSLAYYSITAFSLLLLGRKWLNYSRPVYISLVGLSVLAGIFTYSRTWIILVVLVLSIFLVTTRRKFMSLSMVAIVLLAVLLIYSPTIDAVSEVFKVRFDDVETAGGRTEIFAAYNEFWTSKPSYILVGAGAMCYKNIFDYGYSMHSGLQQIYVSYGIAGIILFIFVIRQFFKKYINKSLPLLFYLPFFACFLFDQSIQFWDPYYLIFPFLVTAYVFRDLRLE